jgi:hypothetical protein
MTAYTNMQAYPSLTEGLIEDLMVNHKNQVEATASIMSQGPSAGTGIMVDNVLLRPTLADLLKEVRTALSRSMTRIKFLALDAPPCDAIAIYREGDTFALGFLGRVIGTSKYYVSHPGITNDKFKNTRPEHHAILSSGIPHIVKAVKKYCGPAQPPAVIADTTKYMLPRLSHAYKQARNELSEFRSKYIYSGRVLDEFASVLKGQAPSADIVQAMAQYETLMVESSAERNAQINICLFMFSQLPSGVTLTQFKNFGVVKFSNEFDMFIRTNASSTNPEDMRVYTTVENLPDEILSRVSTLSMLESDTYLRGIGYKFRQNIFYVELPIEVERAARVGSTL